jgi:hypothetical protein
MPSTLPVPSKGALRTLRHLALGTSCTVAFSAGLLTEDRRRRISSAREVHDNARKIKAAKGYHHGSGRLLGEIGEDKIMGDEEAILLSADWTMRKLTKETNEAQKQAAGKETQNSFRTQRVLSQRPDFGVPGVATLRNSARPSDMIANPELGSPQSFPSNIQTRPATQKRTISEEDVTSRTSVAALVTSDTQKVAGKRHRQYRTLDLVQRTSDSRDLKQENSEILSQPDSRLNTCATILEDNPEDIDTAISGLLEALRKETEVSATGIRPDLLDTAARISRMCTDGGRDDLSESVLASLLPYSFSISEEQFQLFEPYTLIERILDEASENATKNRQVLESKLKMACLIYLNGYKVDVSIPPGVNKSEVVRVGKRLFEAIHLRKWHRLSHDLYVHMYRYNTGISKSATYVGYLIIAAHGIGDYRGVFDYFERLYAKCSPSFLQLSEVLRCVLDATTKLDDTKYAEQAIVMASQLAKSSKFKLKTTPVLEFLGHQWRLKKDIRQTIQSFESLKTFFLDINHPGAVYGAIIQWCIEVNKEDIAQSYYHELEAFYTVSASDLRIFGHFAFAKALRKDWAGVEQDLLNMALLASASGDIRSKIDLKDTFASSFAPVLKLFAQSHTLTQTEKFVLGFLENNSLLLTPYISNIMIDQYSAAKETSSLFRWIETARASGCEIDSVSTNIILKHCRQTWNFSFEETCQLYQRICELGGHTVAITDSQVLGQLIGSPETQPFHRKISRLARLYAYDDSSSDLLGTMKACMSKDNPAAAIQHYERAVTSRIPLGPKHVGVAVTACIRHKGVEQTQILIKDAHSRGIDVKYAVAYFITKQIHSSSDMPIQALRDSVVASIASLEAVGIGIDQSIITHTMNLLVQHREPGQAIDFWSVMSERYKASATKLELETLSVLLKAYRALQSSYGINWVTYMLSKSGLIPDRRFKGYAQLMLKEANTADESSYPVAYKTALKILISKILKVRAAHELEKGKVREMTLTMLTQAMKRPLEPMQSGADTDSVNLAAARPAVVL